MSSVPRVADRVPFLCERNSHASRCPRKQVSAQTGVLKQRYRLMGGFGSGGQRKPGRRTVDSCPVLDINHLSATGRLTPGWSGTCQCADSGGAYLIHLRTETLSAETQRLHLSIIDAGELDDEALGVGEHKGIGHEIGLDAGPPTGGKSKSKGKSEGVTEVIPIVRMPCQLGGDCAYFICPGLRASDNSAGVGCGRRLAKLYLVNRYFACRHCHQLVYVSKYEKQPWQRALRRANKLKQRFGADSNPSTRLDNVAPSTGFEDDAGRNNAGLGSSHPEARLDNAGIFTLEKPKGMHVDTYTHLLDELLRTETQASEASANQIQRLLDRVEDSIRRKARFTL
jgi:hypothetical protein